MPKPWYSSCLGRTSIQSMPVKTTIAFMFDSGHMFCFGCNNAWSPEHPGPNQNRVRLQSAHVHDSMAQTKIAFEFQRMLGVCVCCMRLAWPVSSARQDFGDFPLWSAPFQKLRAALVAMLSWNTRVVMVWFVLSQTSLKHAHTE